jgi:hypothetical protein
MAPIMNQRMTAELDGEFVVFLIGAQVNRLWRIDHWWPVARAMNRMMRELAAEPVRGLLGFEQWGGRRSITVQYWRSLDHLFDYAKDKSGEHRKGWRDFSRLAAKTDSVGVWHETYIVRPGTYENLYHHMPRFGLGAVGELQPAVGHGRQRMARKAKAA